MNRNRNQMRGKQGSADSKDPRVNLDNERESKFQGKPGNGKPHGKREKGGKSSKYMNDFSWYNKFPNLINAAARVTFGNLVGEYNSEMGNNAVPGIMTISYEPTIGGQITGITKGTTDPGTWSSVGINQAAESRYSFVVHANSRNESYDSSDLMLVSVCGASIFSLLAMGIRAYGTMTDYSPENKYQPQALIEASGFSFIDLQENYSHMWFDLNQRIARANQIWIPKDQPIINRWFWMNSAYYTDASSGKAQIYLFRPTSYLVWDQLKYGSGPACVRKFIQTSGLSWSSYLSKVDEALTALLESLDRGTMYGDVLKAYGAGNIFAMNEIPLDYKTPIVYEKEVLTQIENLTVFPRDTTAPAALDDIVQYENTIVQVWGGTNTASEGIPVAKVTPWATPGASLLNFHGIPEPTVPDITIATRLKCGTPNYVTLTTPVIQGTGSSVALHSLDCIVPQSCGTEIVTSVRVYYYQYSYPISAGKITPSLQYVDISYFGSFNNMYTQLWAWSAFDWAPWIYQHGTPVVTGGGTDIVPNTNDLQDAAYTGLYGDWDNYTFIHDDTLSRIHLAAEFSLWGMNPI